MAKKRIVIPVAIILIATGVLIYCIATLSGYRTELDNGDNGYEELAQRYLVPETEQTALSETDSEVGQTENTAVPKVNTEAVSEEIPDYIAWIYSENTPINYPVVQAEDNDYYLRRLPNGKKNVSGSIFMDYRCSADFSDFNTIIYGHSFKNSTRLFGTLCKYSKDGYLAEHPVIYMSTNERIYTGYVFAGFTIGESGYVFNIPANDAEREEYLAKVRADSDFESDVDVGINDKLVVLSTCSYTKKNSRYVLFLLLE